MIQSFVTKIYGIHNGDYRFVYVGSTIISLNERLRLHKQRAQHSNSRLSKWIRSNLDRAQIVLIEESSLDEARFAEARWIAILDTFHSGVNSNEHGREGVHAHSEETRRKISQAHIGKSHPKRAFRKRRPTSDETKAKQSISAKNRVANRKCNQCSISSTPSGISKHQNKSGHVGWTIIPV